MSVFTGQTYPHHTRRISTGSKSTLQLVGVPSHLCCELYAPRSMNWGLRRGVGGYRPGSGGGASSGVRGWLWTLHLQHLPRCCHLRAACGDQRPSGICNPPSPPSSPPLSDASA